MIKIPGLVEVTFDIALSDAELSFFVEDAVVAGAFVVVVGGAETVLGLSVDNELSVDAVDNLFVDDTAAALKIVLDSGDDVASAVLGFVIGIPVSVTVEMPPDTVETVFLCAATVVDNKSEEVAAKVFVFTVDGPFERYAGDVIV